MDKLQPLALKAISILRKNLVLICILLFGIMYGYLVYTAGQQAELEPSETAINDAFKSTNRPKLDAEAAEKLQQLESRNIDVKAIFDEARNNPFSE